MVSLMVVLIKYYYNTTLVSDYRIVKILQLLLSGAQIEALLGNTNIIESI